MSKHKSRNLSAGNPLVHYAGDAPKCLDPYLQTVLAMKPDKLGTFLATAITGTPDTLFGDAKLKSLLGTLKTPFQVGTVSVNIQRTTGGVAEVHSTFDFVVAGRCQGDDRDKRSISGQATAVFVFGGMVFDVNSAEVNPDGDSAVVVPDSDSPQPK